MTMLARAALVLLAVLPSAPLAAQSVQRPAGFVAQQAVAFGEVGQPATSVSATNPLPVTGIIAPVDMTPVTVTPGAATNAVLFTADTTGYGGVSFQITGTWAGTVSFYISDDNVTYSAVYAWTVNGSTASNTPANNLYFVPATHRYVRATVPVYTSGTVTGTAYLRTNLPLFMTVTQLSAGVQTIGNVLRAIPFSDTTAALAAGATFTGTSRDTGAAAGTAQPWNMFSCFGRADQAGTLNLQGSTDNVTFYTEATAAVSANTPTALSGRVYVRYHRCQLVNGATAQGSLIVNSQLGE